MKIQDFEKFIQKTIYPGLKIRPNLNHPDIAGIYIDGVYLGVACPPGDIYDHRRELYVDAVGNPHRTIQETIDMIHAKLRVLTQEKYNLLNEDTRN